MVDVVTHENEENWVYAEGVDSMTTCNGCGMDIGQWYIDNRYNYETAADASTALSFFGDETGCPCGHGSTTNAKKLNQVAPIIETKTYAAELPVRKKCTLCGTTKPWSIEDISNRDIWIEHTKEVVVCEAWDEELYIDEDSTKLDENYNEIPVPAGSLIDTILPVMSTMKSSILRIPKLARKFMLQYPVVNIHDSTISIHLMVGFVVLNAMYYSRHPVNSISNIHRLIVILSVAPHLRNVMGCFYFTFMSVLCHISLVLVSQGLGVTGERGGPKRTLHAGTAYTLGGKDAKRVARQVIIWYNIRKLRFATTVWRCCQKS